MRTCGWWDETLRQKQIRGMCRRKGEKMNADEVVRACRICAKNGYCDNCPAYQLDGDCLAPVMIRAADLIESLQAHLVKAQSDLDMLS